jgi:hypothetical protein
MSPVGNDGLVRRRPVGGRTAPPDDWGVVPAHRDWLGVHEVDGARQGRGGVRVLRAEPHARQCLGERGELVVPQPALAQGGGDLRVAFSGDHRCRYGGSATGRKFDFLDPSIRWRQ